MSHADDEVSSTTRDSAPKSRSPAKKLAQEDDAFVRMLVGRLRERAAGGVVEAIAPLFARRDEALAPGLSEQSAAILARYDALFLKALSLRYDELDRAFAETNFALAEIDGAGIISYANSALTRKLPDAIGRDFAALFGPRARDVQNVILSGRRESLRLELHRDNYPVVQLRGEIGPLLDEHNRSGAYALLLGLEGEEARFHVLPDAIIRLDLSGNVVFANSQAQELFGSSELTGRSATQLFGAQMEPSITRWLTSVTGHRDITDLPAREGRHSTPVRITIGPSFDTKESRAGVLLTIVPIAAELARIDLQHALTAPDAEPEDLVKGVMKAIKRIIAYDVATFGVYTEDLSHHNTLVVYPEPSWEWTTAWFPLGPKVGDFLKEAAVWGTDLKETTKELSPELQSDPVVQNLIADGIKGFLTLTITGGGQRIRASLSLLAKDANAFDETKVRILHDLGVERALLIAEANIVRRRERLVRELEARLVAAKTYRELARALACGLEKCFKWDYIAVFRIDRRNNRFKLIFQCNETGMAGADADYEQPLHEGLLGSAVAENDWCAVPDTEAVSIHRYKPVVPGRRSALAVPVRVVQQGATPRRDEIEWVLAIEAPQRNAFIGPNMIALRETITLCEGILRLRSNRAMQRVLMDSVEQAVVIVNDAGHIRFTNRWANALFGGDQASLWGAPLAQFGRSEADQEWLKSPAICEQVRIGLALTGRVTVPTLASQRPLHDDFGHRAWLFTDLREQAYQTNWGYLEETVNEVAQNARLPLTLGRSLIRKAKDLLSDVKVTSILDTAIRQLGKADITYERLANSLALREEPGWPERIFDVAEQIRSTIAGLPIEDARACETSYVEGRQGVTSCFIAGWPEQLSFVFRTLLEYLLARRPSSTPVTIVVEAASARLNIRFSAEAHEPTDQYYLVDPPDRIAAAAQRARDAASLGSGAVKRVIERHGGEFVIREDGTNLTFSITLPACVTETD